MPLGRAKENEMPNKIVSVTWACEVCGKAHPTEEVATACERLPVEEPIFSVGERVQPLNDSGTSPEQRTCLYHDRQYQAIGTVVETRIVPPLVTVRFWVAVSQECQAKQPDFLVPLAS